LLEDRLPPGDTVVGVLASSSVLLGGVSGPALQDPVTPPPATTDTSSISLVNQPTAPLTLPGAPSNPAQVPSTAGAQDPSTTAVGPTTPPSTPPLANPLDAQQMSGRAAAGASDFLATSALAGTTPPGMPAAPASPTGSGPTTTGAASGVTVPPTNQAPPPSPTTLAAMAGLPGRTIHRPSAFTQVHHGKLGSGHGRLLSGPGKGPGKGHPGHQGTSLAGPGGLSPLVTPPGGSGTSPSAPQSPSVPTGPSNAPNKLPYIPLQPVIADTYSGFLGSQWLQRMSLPSTWTSSMPDPGAPYKSLFVWDSQGRMLVEVRAKTAAQVSAMESDLVNKDGLVLTGTNTAQYMVTGYLPRKSILSLASATGFSAATPVWAPIQWAGSVMTEGDALIKPQGDASVGDGTGTTIGILSDSINQISSNVGTPGIGIAQAQATGDLPARGVNVLQDGTPNNTDEGLGMAEVIYDVAPGANLAFNTSNGGPQAMAAGIQALATTGGANVIVDDTAYPNEPFFNPGVISKAIDLVTSRNNVVYVTAAGNLGNNAWQDSYRPVTAMVGGQSGTFENFASGGTPNVLQQFSLAPGQSINLDLQWDNAFLEGGSPALNYQVHTSFTAYVTTADGSRILDHFGDANQNTDEAMQRVYYTNTGSTTQTYALAIALQAVEPVPLPNPTPRHPQPVPPPQALPTTLKWIRFDNGAPAQYQGAPTIFGHAGDVNAVTVGAAPASNPSTPEPSSSQGPVTLMFDNFGTRLRDPNVLANKPTLFGPDGVHTANFPGQPPGHPLPAGQHPVFSGTSAAAAHVAGGAGIYIQASPSTPSIVIRADMAGNVKTMAGTRTLPGFFQVVPVTPTEASQNAGSVLQVGPVVNATNMLGDQSEESIAVNPLNPNQLFIGANDNNAINTIGMGMVASFSTDGGATWHSRDIGTGTDNVFPAFSDPTVAWDKFGNLFYAYVDAINPDIDDIIMSTDGGQSFTNLVQIFGTNLVTGVLDQPSIAVGPGPGGVGSSIWLTADDAAGSDKILVAGAPITGPGQVGTFTPNLFMPGSLNGAFGDIAVGPNGQVFTYYVHNTTTVGPDTLQGNLITGDFTSGVLVSNAITISNTNVGSFDPIPGQDERTIDAKGALAWDHSGGRLNGRLYIIYTDAPRVGGFTTEDGATGSFATNIFMRFSNDNGLTWSAPVQVNDDTSGNSHFWPRIAVDQGTGAVAASWYDARNDQGNGGVNDLDGKPNTDVEMFGAVSFDGDCFTKNVQIQPFPSSSEMNANSGNDFGDYTGLCFGGSVFHPAWTDNSASLNPPNPDPPSMEIATAAIKVPSIISENDNTENDTSDVALNLGTMNLGQSLLLEGQVIGADGGDTLPDYDWFRWTVGANGTFSTGFNILATDGNLEIHLFRLEKDGTLTQLAQASSAGQEECNFNATLSVAAQEGQTLLVEVKGVNSSPGVYGHGIYDLTARLQ
jgi:hypothetical protein